MSSLQPRVLVLDRTNELAARLRHTVVAAGAVVKACPDAGAAQTHVAGGQWDVIRYLGALERLGMAPGNISVVLNKTWELHQPPPRHFGFDADHIAIPYSRDVTRSINVGVPLIVGKPKSTISAMLTMALSAVLSEAPKTEPTPVLPAEPIGDEVDVRVDETVVELDLTDDQPVEIDLSESPLGRGRAPPLNRYHPARPPN